MWRFFTLTHSHLKTHTLVLLLVLLLILILKSRMLSRGWRLSVLVRIIRYELLSLYVVSMFYCQAVLKEATAPAANLCVPALHFLPTIDPGLP